MSDESKEPKPFVTDVQRPASAHHSTTPPLTTHHSPLTTHPSRSAWLTLAVLFGINTMNFFDRQILPAVQEKIKDEWKLSDSQLGDLGTAFILLYAAVGLPLGHLADVSKRKWILAIGVAVWSLLTAGSGIAWSFWALYVLRLGVGVGEASCAPTSSSLIGDLFPPERRARAMSLFMLGLPVGLALSNIVSGRIAKFWGWREAFFVAGLPGLLLAVAVLFIPEPRRGAADVHLGDAGRANTLTFWAGLRRVLALPTMWLIIASGALHNFNMYALGQFLPSLLKRYHHLDIDAAGDVSGLVDGCGALGMFLGGWLGDRAFRRWSSGRLLVSWVALALAVPALLLALAAPAGQVRLFVVWLLAARILLFVYYGTVYATIQDIIPPSLRGTAMAVYFCAMYYFGAAAGPSGTGRLSDYFARRAAEREGVEPVMNEAGHMVGPDKFLALGLHEAMYVVPIVCAVLVLVLFAASLTVTRDRERLLDKARQ